MEQNQQQLKQLVEKLIATMDLPGHVVIDERNEEFIRVNIETDQAASFIGRGGENLRALQQICRSITAKQLPDVPRFIIDINDYQKNRLDLLLEMARNLAKEAISHKQSKWLPPMNPYERRLIHVALAKEEGIKTESEGEGEERRVVIRAVSF